MIIENKPIEPLPKLNILEKIESDDPRLIQALEALRELGERTEHN